MRWPIRNQILLPLIGIQLVAIVSISGLAAWWSIWRVERQTEHRLANLAETIHNARFPMTRGVLEQMRGLSGCEFVIFDEFGNSTSSTVPLEREEIIRRDWHSRRSSIGSSTDLVRFQSGDDSAVGVPGLVNRTAADVIVLYPDVLLQAARRDALLLPVTLGLATLALTVGAVVLVARHIGRRIHAIERQVARVTENDFRAIPLSTCDDELRDLAASVNWMSEHLERMTAEIRGSERAKLLKQLAGGIAHQLRNSITGARMAVQLHQRRCKQTDDQSLQVALRQLLLTEEQIRGLVSLIRDEHRPRIAGQLDALILDVAGLLQPLCEHRQIRLVMSGDAGDVLVQDSDQMRAALLNLCMNAIEATVEGGQVEVHRSAAGDEAVIEVSDDGPGVPEAVLASLFDPFQSTKADGMGLGLALVRQAAHDHHGAVAYQRSQGRTVFHFSCRGISKTSAVAAQGVVGELTSMFGAKAGS
ncbi:sensor histidine kinase [Planctomicrobium piriforme]|uniref:histidine kinase n=1 Tax=Planctomicrobium piriforme TaxID=1576369 RepID=A0A1I3MP63_9PLAN|nr:HAMP domain-containing sensor histidine kinase [Planctomicrobium piriforme]SFI98505.1 hypothetical protein SAMN05421753_11459 [Planctomicrobium piriforme]